MRGAASRGAAARERASVYTEFPGNSTDSLSPLTSIDMAGVTTRKPLAMHSSCVAYVSAEKRHGAVCVPSDRSRGAGNRLGAGHRLVADGGQAHGAHRVPDAGQPRQL